jgi:hypothetical protein
MKRTLSTLFILAAVATASFADGFGVGADVYYDNKGEDDSTNTASNATFQTEVFVRVPYGADMEVTPFIGYYSNVQKDDKKAFTEIGDDYAWTAFSFGSSLSKKIVSAGALSLLAGGKVYVGISGGGDKSYKGDRSNVEFMVAAPLTLDYQLTPTFVLRATATILSLDYSAFTDKPTTGNTWKSSEFSISSFQSGIPVGFYVVF